MVVIVAGDKRQAEAYARKVGLFEKEWRYITHISQARGMIAFTLIYTGQYYLSELHENAEKKDELEARAAKVIYDKS